MRLYLDEPVTYSIYYFKQILLVYYKEEMKRKNIETWTQNKEQL